MKKLLLLVCLMALAGCIESGNFEEKRIRMHEMNRDQDVCEKHPDRCINGITW